MSSSSWNLHVMLCYLIADISRKPQKRSIAYCKQISSETKIRNRHVVSPYSQNLLAENVRGPEAARKGHLGGWIC